MPVPKRKRSHSRKYKRFANKGIKVKAIVQCQNCSEPIIPHSACQKCGFYKGVKVMATKLDRIFKRAEMREAKKAKEATEKK